MGKKEPGLECSEGDQGPGGHSPKGASGKQIAGNEVDGYGGDGEEYAHHGEKGLAGHLQAHREVGQPLVFGPESLAFLVLPAE